MFRQVHTQRNLSATSKKSLTCVRDFASNAGITFKTPEEYFLGAEAKPFVRTFDPAAYIRSSEPSGTISLFLAHDTHLVSIFLIKS
jgi:hypothetical protein